MAFEDYSSAGLQALQGGMQMGMGLRQARMVEQQQQAELQQQQAAHERQQQFVTDLQSATQSGDSKAMLDVMGAYPEQADTITKMIGAKDAQHAKAIGSFAGQLGSMIDAGDMTGAMGLVAQNADIITAQGRDPLQFIQQIKENPALVKQGADAMMLMTMTPEEQLSYRNKLEDQEIQRDRIAATREGHQVSRRRQDMVQSRAGAGGGSRGGAQPSGEAPEGMPNARQGYEWATLADGSLVQVNQGKPFGAGAGQFFNGYDSDGNRIRVPVSAISAPATAATSAREGLVNEDIGKVASASDEDLGAFTGMTGQIGSPSFAAEWTSRYKSPEAREAFTSVSRINRNMQNQGIAAAKDMGASGINTMQEAKMFFGSMPQIDFSSPTALRESLGTINEYTQTFNSQNKVKLGKKSQGADGGEEAGSGREVGSKGPSAPQAAIDYLKANPQFKSAFKAKYGYIPEGV